MKITKVLVLLLVVTTTLVAWFVCMLYIELHGPRHLSDVGKAQVKSMIDVLIEAETQFRANNKGMPSSRCSQLGPYMRAAPYMRTVDLLIPVEGRSRMYTRRVDLVKTPAIVDILAVWTFVPINDSSASILVLSPKMFGPDNVIWCVYNKGERSEIRLVMLEDLPEVIAKGGDVSLGRALQ